MTIHLLPVPLRDNTHVEVVSYYIVPKESIEIRFYGGTIVDDAFVRDPDIGIQTRTLTGDRFAAFCSACEAAGAPVDENHGVLYTTHAILKFVAAVEYQTRGIELPEA